MMMKKGKASNSESDGASRKSRSLSIEKKEKKCEEKCDVQLDLCEAEGDCEDCSSGGSVEECEALEERSQALPPPKPQQLQQPQQAQQSQQPQQQPQQPQQPPPSGPPPTDLFMQQQFDGSFQISDALARLLQTTAPALKTGAKSAASKMGSLDEATTQNVWATIVVLALLQRWWGAYEQSWELTSDKARQWCVSVLLKSLGDRVTARKRVDELIASV